MGDTPFSHWSTGGFFFDQSVSLSPDFLYINQKNDERARDYIWEKCPYLPNVLSVKDLKKLFVKLGIEESFAERNLAIVNIFQAVDVLAKLRIVVCW